MSEQNHIDPDDLGYLADRLDAIILADNLPVPEPLKTQTRTGALLALRDDMRRCVVVATGDDPWEV